MTEEMKKQKSVRRFDEIKGGLRKIEGLVQVAIMSVAFYIMWRSSYDDFMTQNYHGKGKYVLIGVYALITLILFYLLNSFKYGHLRMSEIIISQWVSMFMVNFVTYWQLSLMANVVLNPAPVVLLYVFELFFCVLCVYVYTKIYHIFHVPRNMMMVYGSRNAVNLKFKMDKRSDKYRVTKVISYEEGLDKIEKELVNHDAVIINDVPAQMRNDLLKLCYDRDVRTYVVPKISDIITRGAKDVTLMDTPLLLVRATGPNFFERIFKRAIDLILSTLMIIILSPLMLIVAAAIKINDGGPVFYRQTRVTLGGKHFDIVKFRSMVVDAEKEGKSIPATSDDPRITKVGKVIRAARIDEFPQLFNVFRGDMSLVGPRPERVEHVEKYCKLIPEFKNREKVKGGLTGYAQIYGKYNTAPYDKLRLDLMYIENYSILLDIKLIFMTIPVMFKKESSEGFDVREAQEKMSSDWLDKSGGK